MRKSNSFIGMGLLLAAIISVYAQTPPIITKQPVNQSVSLGARVILGVTATGTEPLSYLWFFNGAPISEAVQRLLILTNAQVSNAGGYSVIITNISGAITSEVAILKVDPTFLKINTGAIVTDTEPSEGVAWFDLDNDNLLDLFVANIQGVMNSVYRNQGDGTFVKIKNAITTMNNSWNGAPGDLNNDGWTDLYVVTPTGAGNHLFRNDRSLDFTSLTDQQCGPPVRDRYESADAAWADYDGDGWLDLFVVNGINASQDDCLYRNIGNGSFIKMTASQVGPLVDDNAKSGSCSWADYNNDGYPDLWVLNLARTNLLYLNNRDGTFSRVIQGSVVEPKIGDATQGGDGGGAWGDYDNDGYQDLFVAGGESFTNSLHRNMGGETFTNVAESAGLAQKTGAALGAWGDYDNDGFLDLFAPSYSGPTNALYHNNGDGTFTAIDVGSPTYEGSSRIGTAWADYDNDGFLDLIISCGNGQNMHNLLYRNQGNGNHWLKVRLIGTTSNRAGIGAKIRVKASIRGKTIWQLRELSGNSGWSGGQGLVTHFGLGDATNIDVVRIEWPSGNVQEMNAVTSDQILTITESTGIKPANPSSCLGGEVTLTSQMTGAYQWLFNEAALTGETNKILKLGNIQSTNAGRYGVVVTSTDQVVTNFVYLVVDTNFTKITTGPQVMDEGGSWASWADIDGDGFADLSVCRSPGKSVIYLNQRDGTFRILDNILPRMSFGEGVEWTDFNNDGRQDFFFYGKGRPSIFYFNNGDGSFTAREFITFLPWGIGVADYDRDGLLDLYLSSSSGARNVLYRNLDGRNFISMQRNDVGALVNTSTYGGVTWADINDDGLLELQLSSYKTSRSLLFRGDDNDYFVAMTNAITRNTSADSVGAAWGDYDNDGRLDLFLACISHPGVLYHNLGNGEFEPVPSAQIDASSCNSAAWADYDNDGFLDLFLTGFNKPNRLYHNNGDGTFTQITTGSFVTDTPSGAGSSLSSYLGLWFDDNNDGFLDLYVANGNDPGTAMTRNFHYHNNGNHNAWLTVKLTGTTSNRQGIGAKVRVQAKYAGQVRWQRRDITGADVHNGNTLYAHFGLRDTKNVDTVRIEWPSGIVQELHDVAPRQILTVTEPCQLETMGPGQFKIRSWPGMTPAVEASSDLSTSNWTTIATVTNVTGTLIFSDPDASKLPQRFYRVRTP